MEVRRVYNKLSVNNNILKRDFLFSISEEMQSLNNVCNIRLMKDYTQANRIELNFDDEVIIETAVKEDEYYEVYSGKIIEITDSENYYYIVCDNNLEINEEITETFEEVSNDDILGELLTDYESDLSSNTWLKFIATGKKREVVINFLHTLSSILEEEVFYYFYENKNVLTHSLSGETYDISDYVVKVGNAMFKIFPLPELKLSDKVKFKNVETNIQKIIRENGVYTLEVEKI